MLTHECTRMCVPACRDRDHVSKEVVLVFASGVLRSFRNCCHILITACNIADGHLLSTKLTFQICMYWKLGFVIAWGDWVVPGPSMLSALFWKLFSSTSLTAFVGKPLQHWRARLRRSTRIWQVNFVEAWQTPPHSLPSYSCVLVVPGYR